MVNEGLMTVVCHYCGYRSDSMLEAARHDAERPESCLLWRQVRKLGRLTFTDERIRETLRHLTVQTGENLDRELDAAYGRIQRAPR